MIFVNEFTHYCLCNLHMGLCKLKLNVFFKSNPSNILASSKSLGVSRDAV